MESNTSDNSSLSSGASHPLSAPMKVVKYYAREMYADSNDPRINKFKRSLEFNDFVEYPIKDVIDEDPLAPMPDLDDDCDFEDSSSIQGSSSSADSSFYEDSSSLEESSSDEDDNEFYDADDEESFIEIQVPSVRPLPRFEEAFGSNPLLPTSDNVIEDGEYWMDDDSIIVLPINSIESGSGSPIQENVISSTVAIESESTSADDSKQSIPQEQSVVNDGVFWMNDLTSEVVVETTEVSSIPSNENTTNEVQESEGTVHNKVVGDIFEVIIENYENWAQQYVIKVDKSDESNQNSGSKRKLNDSPSSNKKPKMDNDS